MLKRSNGVNNMIRLNKRAVDQLRSIKLTRHYTKHAEGSVLIELGDTRILCNASLTEGVPRFLRDSQQGWLTAEYAMLPRSTVTRSPREATLGRRGGRTLEIQRLIARTLRSTLHLKDLYRYTICVDCDVIQADGGTRTAAITGGYVAVVDAIRSLTRRKSFERSPLASQVAAISVGICDGVPVLDLDYTEDCRADVDMNVVMNAEGQFVEVQGAAESSPFDQVQLNQLLDLARQGIGQLLAVQQKALAEDVET